MIKSLIRKTFLYNFWCYLNKHRFEQLQIKNWIDSGRHLPPPHIVKFRTIKEAKQVNGADIFIETGTYKGAMIISCMNVFKKIYSIELDNTLFEEASLFFKSHHHVKIIHGDSGKKIKELLHEIHEPCVFWLDGHYSGGITAKAEIETPIMAELAAIFNHTISGHIILIDDARLFTGENDYPTINGLTNYVLSSGKYTTVKLENDIIIIK